MRLQYRSAAQVPPRAPGWRSAIGDGTFIKYTKKKKKKKVPNGLSGLSELTERHLDETLWSVYFGLPGPLYT